MLSVSELNEQAKNLLESHLGYVEVRGEISRLTKHGSGHWYFTLKDESASIAAAMFRANNLRLKFSPKDGDKVVISGKVSLYSASGSYQLIANLMRPDGIGELELAFKELKERLEKEGLFESKFKKSLPKVPKKIALITSATSAALQDMLKIATERWKACEITIFDSLTQGENAPPSLIKSLQKADECGFDVIVLARGGGSREDLWCFNDESLARAIFSAQTPIISAIGHEIDYVISDFVADFRAPTPTAAMSAVLPDENAYFQYIDELENKLKQAINERLKTAQNHLNLLTAKLSLGVITTRIDNKLLYIKSLENELLMAMQTKLFKLSLNLKTLQTAFSERDNFFKTTQNLVQIYKGGEKVSLELVKIGDEIELVGQNGKKYAKIIKE